MSKIDEDGVASIKVFLALDVPPKRWQRLRFIGYRSWGYWSAIDSVDDGRSSDHLLCDDSIDISRAKEDIVGLEICSRWGVSS